MAESKSMKLRFKDSIRGGTRERKKRMMIWSIQKNPCGILFLGYKNKLFYKEKTQQKT